MADEVKKEKTDIFIGRTIYPDAESVFTARYQSLEAIKDDCYVVLDTNTLLVPYTTSKESLEQIKATYKKLIKANRLVIPAQVAREFAKNRAKKIGELFQQLSSKRNSSQSLAKGKYPLLEGLADYQKSLKLEDEINKSIIEYRETVGKVLDHIRAWTWDDPVSLLYGELFAKGVVKEPTIDEAAIKEDLLRRQTHKIPPAYKDAAKDDSGIGDLLIWQTILDIGRRDKKPVMFVSHEVKPDWWHRSDDQSLYPRYELTDEFRRASDGQTFQIVRLSRLLEVFGVSRPVIDEVKDKETTVTTTRATPVRLRDRAIRALVMWLSDIFPQHSIHFDIQNDFEVRRVDGALELIALFKVFTKDSFNRRLYEALGQLTERKAETSTMIILVGNDEPTTTKAIMFTDMSVLENRHRPLVVGYLSDLDEFVAIYSNDSRVFS